MEVVPTTPLTNVKVLSNVPLDSSYTDTLDFASVSAQTTYFNSKVKYSYTNLTPVRLQNTIRLPIGADALFDCNYLMFQNGNLGNKWLYAFITAINFQNINMCEVKFEIDVLQTWQFDYTLHPSFIERQHSITDNIGDNMVAESIELGDYVNNTFFGGGVYVGSSYSACILSADEIDGKIGRRGNLGGIFSGLYFYTFPLNSPEEELILLNFLETLNAENKTSAIAATFIAPSVALPSTNDAVSINQIGTISRPNALDGYAPINKKLLTYPYCYLWVTNGEGDSNEYRYEYFSNPADIQFKGYASVGTDTEILLKALNYNKQPIDQNYLSLKNYPMFAFNIDTFKQWLALNGRQLPISLLQGSIGVGASLVSKDVVGSVNSLLGIAQVANNIAIASEKPDLPKGTQSTSALVAHRQKDFRFIPRSIRRDYAKIIDDYFSMYGYAELKVGLPNTNSRPSWNYVKTRDVTITGHIPFLDLEKIKSIFNEGVTFWHGDYVGDYTRNNQPS